MSADDRDVLGEALERARMWILEHDLRRRVRLLEQLEDEDPPGL